MSGAPIKSKSYGQIGLSSHTNFPHSEQRRCCQRIVLSAALIAACALFAGCRTTAEVQADRDAEFQTLVGGSMADFMRRTSLTPSDMYPTSSGRTFVIYGPVSTIVLPGSGFVPTVGRTFQCQMLVDTVATDTRGAADTWKVTRITRSGPC